MAISFSQAVKQELLTKPLDPKYYRLMLEICCVLLAKIHTNEVIISSSQEQLINLIHKALKQLHPSLDLRVKVTSRKNFARPQTQYSIICQYDEYFFTSILGLSIIGKQFNTNISIDDLTANQEVIVAMMCFCATGSINNPQKHRQYHLEIVAKNHQLLALVKSIANKKHISFKFTKRKYTEAIYLNKSEEIADFLKLIGSNDALFDFEECRIERDMFLMYNRINNADLANLNKTIDTASKQINAINYLIEHQLLNKLGQKTQLVAQLRINNPNDSFSQLADKSDGQFSKSNISYHLNLILKQVPQD